MMPLERYATLRAIEAPTSILCTPERFGGSDAGRRYFVLSVANFGSTERHPALRPGYVQAALRSVQRTGCRASASETGTGTLRPSHQFSHRGGAAGSGSSGSDGEKFRSEGVHRARSVMYTPPKMTRPDTTSASETCSWRMTIPKTMASNGCRYEKAARREASMRASA